MPLPSVPLGKQKLTIAMIVIAILCDKALFQSLYFKKSIM